MKTVRHFVNILKQKLEIIRRKRSEQISSYLSQSTTPPYCLPLSFDWPMMLHLKPWFLLLFGRSANLRAFHWHHCGVWILWMDA